MKKILFVFLMLFMVFGVMSTLGACQDDTKAKMEKNLEDARDAMKELKRIEKEAKDIMNKP